LRTSHHRRRATRPTLLQSEPHAGRVSRLTGAALFASGPDDPLARRPTDGALLVAAALLLVSSGIVASAGTASDPAARAALISLPDVFEPLWRVGYVAAAAWALLLAVVTLLRRRLTLARNMVLAVALAYVIAALASRIVEDRWPDFDAALRGRGPPVFPAVLLSLTTAALSTASPYLARPFRHGGRWLIALQAVGAAFLGVALVSHALGGIAIGAAAAAIVHLAFASPGGFPTPGRISLALEELGIAVTELDPGGMQRRGVVTYHARDDVGPLVVKVYGRDAWDGQLLTSAWRALVYRNRDPSIVVRRGQQVEHEAFLTLLAARTGVRVPEVVTAGRAGRGDAILVLRPSGTAMEHLAGPALGDVPLQRLWWSMHRLHDAGIVHDRISPGTVLFDDGEPVITDFSAASVAGTALDRLEDDAQVLVTTAVCVGDDRALAAARDAVGVDAIAELVPYLQPAALSPELVAQVHARHYDLVALRDKAVTISGAPSQALVRLRRVDAKSLVGIALLLVASFTLISALSDLDWSSVADDFAHANWWWIVFAVVAAQLARAAGAVSTMGASEYPLPPVPTTAMQFAIAYINLAIPSSAARIAVNVRYLQRVGVPGTAAIAISALESAGGFVVQVLLLLLLPLTADAALDFDLDVTEVGGAAAVLLIVIAVVLVAAAIVCLSPRLRVKAKAAVHSAAEAMRVLRSPSKVTMLLGANLATQVLFAIAISATLRAFGTEAPLSTLLFVNTLVTLFAGVMPVPGGIGVTEAALVWGLTSIGIPDATALAVAIAYRGASFYLPPIWGYFSYRWLTANAYL
jgi:uncharacterized membrane protein YbhN (UPF0104 family)